MWHATLVIILLVIFMYNFGPLRQDDNCSMGSPYPNYICNINFTALSFDCM